MSPDRRIAPCSQNFFHAGTGRAGPVNKEDAVTDLDFGFPKRQKVDAGHQEIAAEFGGVDQVYPKQVGNHRQVLGLEKGDGAFSGRCVITIQPIGKDVHGTRCYHCGAAFGSEVYPVDPACARMPRHHGAKVTANQSEVSITISSRSEAILAIFTAS